MITCQSFCDFARFFCDLGCLALFAKLASDEVAQGGAVVPPVETPFLVAAVHSNLEDGPQS